jgi:UDP-N-acetylmuramyl pentapeptide phosphotransferase/UDP-N-acetylglucosamine-1-phosphate transferase
MQHSLTAFAALAILVAAAVLSASLIVALGPWLARYAVAKPNTRSSHKVPTPQGGGIVVVGATIAVSGVLFFSTATRQCILACRLVLRCSSDRRRRRDG